MIKHFNKHIIIIYFLIFEIIFLGISTQIELKQVSENKVVTQKQLQKKAPKPPIKEKEHTKSLANECERNNQQKELNLSLQGINKFNPQIDNYCIETLILSYNDFEVFPQYLDAIHHLNALYLQGNLIRVLKLVGCEQLEILDISSNTLSEVHPTIGKMQALKELNLSDNKNLTDLPNEMSSLKHLKVLNIIGTPLAQNTMRINELQKMLPNTQIITKH